MQKIVFKITTVTILALTGAMTTGCTKSDNGGASAPATPTSVANETPGAALPKDNEDIETTGGSFSKDVSLLKRMGCPAKGDLDSNCISKLANKKFPKLPMYTKKGSYNVALKGPWILRQMYQVREDRSFRKMRGINHDYSKAGPMLIWNNSAVFQSWAYADVNYTSRTVRKTSDGAVRFEFEHDSFWDNDTFVLECFVPAMMEGRKLLCVWYHMNPYNGRDEFRGYIEFDRNKPSWRN